MMNRTARILVGIWIIGALLFLGGLTTLVTKAKSQDEKAVCVVWAETPQWTVHRCESPNGEMCMVFSSGMGQCRLE